MTKEEKKIDKHADSFDPPIKSRFLPGEVSFISTHRETASTNINNAIVSMSLTNFP